MEDCIWSTKPNYRRPRKDRLPGTVFSSSEHVEEVIHLHSLTKGIVATTEVSHTY